MHPLTEGAEVWELNFPCSAVVEESKKHVARHDAEVETRLEECALKLFVVDLTAVVCVDEVEPLLHLFTLWRGAGCMLLRGWCLLTVTRCRWLSVLLCWGLLSVPRLWWGRLPIRRVLCGWRLCIPRLRRWLAIPTLLRGRLRVPCRGGLPVVLLHCVVCVCVCLKDLGGNN